MNHGRAGLALYLMWSIFIQTNEVYVCCKSQYLVESSSSSSSSSLLSSLLLSLLLLLLLLLSLLLLLLLLDYFTLSLELLFAGKITAKILSVKEFLQLSCQ